MCVVEISRDDISGLVLAGGRGSRMGGIDKGLQTYRGATLAENALARLRTQVGVLMISANRNLERYAAMCVPVWPDNTQDFDGPLAGMLAGLEHCPTDYLVTVPCDTPNFPLDLVERLREGLVEADAEIAVAHTRKDGELLPQPVFCLARADLATSLREFLARGERKTGFWSRQHRRAVVVFDDEAAFANVNTLAELEAAERAPEP